MLTQRTRLTMSQIRTLNKENGHTWFDKGSMRWFNTSLPRKILKYNIFITSEYMDNAELKKYSLRICSVKNGAVETIGEFNKMTKYQAEAEAQKIIRAFDKWLGNRELETLENLSYISKYEGPFPGYTFESRDNADNSSFSFDLVDRGNGYEIIG